MSHVQPPGIARAQQAAAIEICSFPGPSNLKGTSTLSSFSGLLVAKFYQDELILLVFLEYHCCQALDLLRACHQ